MYFYVEEKLFEQGKSSFDFLMSFPALFVGKLDQIWHHSIFLFPHLFAKNILNKDKERKFNSTVHSAFILYILIIMKFVLQLIENKKKAWTGMINYQAYEREKIKDRRF